MSEDELTTQVEADLETLRRWVCSDWARIAGKAMGRSVDAEANHHLHAFTCEVCQRMATENVEMVLTSVAICARLKTNRTKADSDASKAP